MKKAIIAIVLISCAILLGWQIFQKATASLQQGGRRRGQPPVAVELSPVSKTTIVEVGSFTGSLNAYMEYKMAPKVSGRLERILVHIGDVLHKGQVVAELDSAEYQEEVLQAEAGLEMARATLAENRTLLGNAERELGRTQSLRKTKIASESQLDAALSEVNTLKAKLQLAQAQIAQKEAALKVARVHLGYTKLVVQHQDQAHRLVVGERYVDQGALITSNTPIISVLEIGKLIAAVHVIERDYSKIRPGLAAELTTDAFPGRKFTGQVLRIAPMLQEKSREAKVEIEVPNPDGSLKPGMFIRARVEFAKKENVTVVPREALIKRNGVSGVYLADLKENKAVFTPVELGIVTNKLAEVKSPALKGQVITLGQHLLSAGSKILVPDGNPPSGGGKRKGQAAGGENSKGSKPQPAGGKS